MFQDDERDFVSANHSPWSPSFPRGISLFVNPSITTRDRPALINCVFFLVPFLLLAIVANHAELCAPFEHASAFHVTANPCTGLDVRRSSLSSVRVPSHTTPASTDPTAPADISLCPAPWQQWHISVTAQQHARRYPDDNGRRLWRWYGRP